MKKYLNSLIRKHHKLGKQISEAKRNEKQVRDMKKLRLQLKEHISHLRRGPVRSSA